MALPSSFASWTMNDNTRKANGEPESANFSLPIITLTPANAAATETAVLDLETAILNITLGELAKREIVYARDALSSSPAASVQAQRELKLLLRYTDAVTGAKFRVSIPTFDLSQLPANSEFLNLAAGVGAALKTAFEAVVRSPDNDANAVVLQSAQFVGRNS